jgi:hypothetical protein
MTLSDFSRLVRSEVVLIVLGLISILVFSVALVSFLNKEESPRGTTWNNIVPGSTTKEQLFSTMGQPEKSEQTQEGENYFYPSSSEFRPHEVDISDSTVKLIKEQITGIEGKKLTDFLSLFGAPEAKVYGTHGSFAPGSFWGSQGIMVFANENDGTVIEVWYFEPTTVRQFVASNPGLSLEEPKHF